MDPLGCGVGGFLICSLAVLEPGQLKAQAFFMRRFRALITRMPAPATSGSLRVLRFGVNRVLTYLQESYKSSFWYP